MIGMKRIENVIKLLGNDRGGVFNMAVRGVGNLLLWYNRQFDLRNNLPYPVNHIFRFQYPLIILETEQNIMPSAAWIDGIDCKHRPLRGQAFSEIKFPEPAPWFNQLGELDIFWMLHDPDKFKAIFMPAILIDFPLRLFIR